MRRLLIALTLGIIGLLAVPAAAQDKPVVKQEKPAASLIDHARIDAAEKNKIVFILSGYEYFPTREDLDRLSADAPNLLMAIAEDTTVKPSTRIQAIRALALFPESDTAALYLQKVLQEGGQREDKYLRAAMTSTLRGFADRGLDWVEPYMAHPDVHMRLSAFNTIGKLGGERGKQLLRARQLIEQDAFARESLDRLVDPTR